MSRPKISMWNQSIAIRYTCARRCGSWSVTLFPCKMSLYLSSYIYIYIYTYTHATEIEP